MKPSTLNKLNNLQSGNAVGDGAFKSQLQTPYSVNQYLIFRILKLEYSHAVKYHNILEAMHLDVKCKVILLPCMVEELNLLNDVQM